MNSEPLLQANDSYDLNSASPKKKDIEPCAQVDDATSPKYRTEPSESVTMATNCASQMLKPLSADLTIDSQAVGTNSSGSEHVISPQVHKLPLVHSADSGTSGKSTD